MNSRLVCPTYLSQKAWLCVAKTSLSGWTPFLGILQHSYAEDMEISTGSPDPELGNFPLSVCLLLGVLRAPQNLQ